MGVDPDEGREVHVLGALPGETAMVRVDHVSPHAARAWGTQVGLASPPSPDRVQPACPAHPECGGCVLQHLAYPAQLAAKQARVERALGHPVAPIVASPCQTGYRNKAKYVLAPGPVCASYAPGTHRTVDMTGCRVPEAPVQAAAEALARRLAGTGLPVYDERTRAGELRHLVVRANHEGRLLAVIVCRTAAPAVRDALAGIAPELAGVVLNVNPTTGGRIFSDEDHLLSGEATLADRVGEVTLELSARAFFQVNREQAARLYAEAARLALAAGPRIVDLYTGVGGIALTLAARGARVLGIESHAPAVADARRSAAGMDARFEVADAATGLAMAGPIDACVVNPPRKGLHEGVRRALVAAAPRRIVYVSCGPESLAADVRALRSAGWRSTFAQPFDLLPGTPHVETVCCLDLDTLGTSQ